jgi:RND family efflux transporter MFP subunit
MRPDDDEFLDERDDDRRRRARLMRIGAGVVLAAALLFIGLAGGVMWGERRAARESADARAATDPAKKKAGGSMSAMPGMSDGGKPDSAAGATSDEPVEISLTPEAIERAGIKTAEVKSQAAGASLTVPATVTSNAYRDTKINALVGGIVRQVSAELGSPVERGDTLAVIFSSELADAQMKYLSMRAMLQADHQKVQRTQKLVELGAASRQELEEVTATHAAHETELAAARQRLLLLGLSSDRVAKLDSASQVVSEVNVPSPADGLVVTRSVNPGQVVSSGQELFAVTDLSVVWLIGDLYEKDFASVRVGTAATVTVPSAPKTSLRGRVAYIDPRVEPATRTAKVRVEVPNRNGELRLGMFVTISFETSASRRVVVPRAALQSIGERTVVYVPAEGEEGKFTERTVKLGQPGGEFVEVLEGLKAGEKVVTTGSFLLRAEAGRTRSGS